MKVREKTIKEVTEDQSSTWKVERIMELSKEKDLIHDFGVNGSKCDGSVKR